MSLYSKTMQLIRTQGMFSHWIEWNLKYFGFTPKLKLLSGQKIAGFRNFSEFWGAKSLIPAASELNLINSLAGHTGAIIDVGANLGYLSLALAGIRPDCAVHAFEPSPETFMRLRHNLVMNRADSICAHQIALSDMEGSVQFLDNALSPTTNRLIKAKGACALPLINVKATLLDRFLDLHRIDDVAFLKIDVEGYEAEVLLGASNLLRSRRCKAGLIELCPANLEQAGSSVGRLLRVTHELGYRLHYLTETGILGAQVSEQNASTVVLDNVALLPNM